MARKSVMAMAAVGLVAVVSISYNMPHIAEHHTESVTGPAAEKDTTVALIRSLQREHREMTEMFKQSLDRMELKKQSEKHQAEDQPLRGRAGAADDHRAGHPHVVQRSPEANLDQRVHDGSCAHSQWQLPTGAASKRCQDLKPGSGDMRPEDALCVSGVEGMMASSADLGETVRIVQVGAHTGFEENDPIAKPLVQALETIYHNRSSATGYRHASGAEWTMVEASPPIYEKLVKNIKQHERGFLRFAPVNVGVMTSPDDASAGPSANRSMNFYGLHSDIDVNTGWDARGKRQLPYWITQVGSFNKDHVLKIAGKMGLTDYVVEHPVPVVTLQTLFKTDKAARSVHLLLIDTEGFDCDIILATNFAGALKPSLVVFEQKHCLRSARGAAMKHMQRNGYHTELQGENVYCIIRPCSMG